MKTGQFSKPEKMLGKKSMHAKKRILPGGIALCALLIMFGCAPKTMQQPSEMAPVATSGTAVAGEPRESATEPVQPATAVAALEAEAPASLPVRFQKPSYLVKETSLADESVGTDEELALKVGADISTPTGPIPLRDVIKRLAALQNFNVSWASDVNQYIEVDVDIRANDDFFSSIDNLLRQVDYFYEIQDNTIIVRFQETTKFELALPPRLTGTDTIKAEGGNKITVDREDDRWDKIAIHLQKLLGLDSSAVTDNTKAAAIKDNTAETDGRRADAAASGQQQERPFTYIREHIKSRPSFSIDKPLGIISVTAPRPLLEKVGEYIKNLKTDMYRLVSIEAKILEVTLTHDNRSGIDWADLLRESGFDFNATFGNAGVIHPSSGDFLNTLSLQNKAFTLVLDALNENGETKVLANPKISVMNGQPAMIYVGDRITYIKEVSTTIAGQSGTPTTDVTPAEILSGLRLEIYATIVNDDEIILSFIPLLSEVEQPIEQVEIGQNNKISLPQVRERTMNSIVRLKNGEMLVVGGLISNKNDKNSNGVIGLEKIPLLGSLFKSKSDSGERKELVILLQPRIVI